MERPATRLSADLPAHASRFIGREREIHAISGAVERGRLVTLTGSAGTGKTRLAIEVARRTGSARSGGAYFVDLAALGEGALLPEAFAAAVGIRQAQARPVLELLVEWIDEAGCLLIVDNCEHLVEACSELIGQLLRRCPKLKVLATSRESLHVDGEVVWTVQPLTLPESSGSMRDVSRSEAVSFFIEKAQQAAPGFALSPSNASAVASVCRRLDGLPLALELAAARTRVLDVDAIVGQLDDRFRFLTGGFRGAPARQRTLRAAIDWSFELLTVAEQQLFVRLSVFAGGFDLAAARAVCSGGAVLPEQVVDLLDRLIAKSLVVPVDAGDGRRYRLLDSIKAYGVQQLQDRALVDACRKSHAEHFSALAGSGIDQAEGSEWLLRMAAEIDNLREALAWSRDFNPALHTRLAIQFGWYSMRGGFVAEGVGWLERALTLDVQELSLRADACSALGFLEWRAGGYAKSIRWMTDCVSLRRRIGDERGLARALSDAAFAAAGTDSELVTKATAEQLEISERIGDREMKAVAYVNLSLMQLLAGDAQAARDSVAESFAVFEGSALDIVPTAYNSMAWALLTLGDGVAAGPVIAKGLLKRLRSRDFLDMAASLDAAAEHSFQLGARERALCLNGAADAIRRRGGAIPNKAAILSRGRWLARAQRSVGPRAEKCWLTGFRLSPEEAAAYALEPVDAPLPRSGSEPGGDLSGREMEVAELVAVGLSNDEIASRLRLSRRTVEAHLDHIRVKLGARSRVDVATWVAARSTPPLASRS